MKTFAALTITGVGGILLFKFLVLPIIGLFMGLLVLIVKLALVAAVIFFIYSMIKKRKEADAA